MLKETNTKNKEVKQELEVYEDINEELIGVEIQQYFQQNPLALCKYVLGVDVWSKQRDIMYSVRDNPQTTVVSCRGSGKTFTLAAIILWYSIAYYPAVVVVISPTFKQTSKQLFGEVKDLYHNAKIKIGGRMLDTVLSFSPIAYALGMAVGEGQNRMEGSQGWHSKSGRILIILDEASGIQSQIFEAVQGSLNTESSRLLLSGNPTRSYGDFYDASRSIDFNKIQISIHDIPNFREKKEIIKGLSGVAFEKRMARKYGRDSDEYAIHVLGEFSNKGGDSFIPLELIEGAIGREKPLPFPDYRHLDVLRGMLDGTLIGVDVARYGTDKTVIFERRGLVGKVIREYSKNDIAELAGEITRLILDDYDEDVKVMIDGAGIGGGLVDTLLDDNRIADKIVDVNVGKKANDEEVYQNMRAEGTALSKQWLQYGALCGDRRFIEASYFKQRYDKRGRLQIESKDEMRQRGIPSPDYFDSLMLTFCDVRKAGYRLRYNSNQSAYV